MKNKIMLAALMIGLLACAACSSSAPANANKTTNTTNTSTTTTTTNTASTANTPANTSNSSASNTNTNTTSNSSSTTAQGGAQDFTLVNQTGVEIDKLFISPSDVDEWGSDILGQDTLPNGQAVEIKFSRSEKAAKWDLKIEDSKGTSIEWEDLNLLEISKITLHFKDGKPTAQAE